MCDCTVNTCVVRAVVYDGLHLGSGLNGDEMRILVRHLAVFLGFDPSLRSVDELIARRSVSNVARRTCPCMQ